VANPLVAEAAVVGRPDDLTGEAVSAFVVLKQPRPSGDEAKRIANDLRNWSPRRSGRSAKPKDIRFGDNLPKTRSGKIMRRLLRAIAKGEAITQDVSTLENRRSWTSSKRTSDALNAGRGVASRTADRASRTRDPRRPRGTGDTWLQFFLALLHELTKYVGLLFIGQFLVFVLSFGRHEGNPVYRFFRFLTSPINRSCAASTPRRWWTSTCRWSRSCWCSGSGWC